MPKPPRSDEWTAPLDDELTAPYDTGEIRQLDRSELRRVLDLLATEPLRMRSDNLVPRPWGGHRLVAFKQLETQADPARYGESFEVAAYPIDAEAARYPSVVEFADNSSMALSELLGRAGETILGPAFFAAYGPNIPLLPKFLDIAGLLSVQSHPAGNPEAYIIIDAEPGATLRLGFRRDVDAAELGPRLHNARAMQEELAGLVWVDQLRIAPVFSELLAAPDASRRLVDRLVPLLREVGLRPRLETIVVELVSCYREMLELLNEIPVEAGMVLFNADRPSADRPASSKSETGEAGESAPPSAQIHCLGDPAGRAVLMLEIRRPGVTYRAWDHVRFPARELAIDTALASATCSASEPADFRVTPTPVEGRPGVLRSVACSAFIIDHLRPHPGLAVDASVKELPTTLHVIRGSARMVGPAGVDWGIMRAGESALLPAGLGSLRLEGLQPDTELIQVTMPVPARAHADALEAGPRQARRRNLVHLARLVADSEGPSEVIAIVNGGDGAQISERLLASRETLFRADGGTRVFAHAEQARRGQLLGLLDALRSRAQTHGALDPERVALGIMLPGRGTRLSPLTQRLHGIKPSFPVPVFALGSGADGVSGEWLDGATASLWTWVQVSWALERQGFRGVAWKWGDEPQVAARLLSALDDDLSDVDAVRFGASVSPSVELAEHKEWLIVDQHSGDFITQLRRRPLAELEQRIAGCAVEGSAAAFVHMGSPAFSHLFLRHAERVFGELEGWLDVDGYLFEALTHDATAWAAEVARDANLRVLLERCPDFYERVGELRRGVEAERGHPLRMVAVDLGSDPYWGDIGQLGRAREAWARLLRDDEEGSFARFLASVEEIEPDAYGNLLVGEDAAIPMDGSVRNCVVIHARIEAGQAQGAVLFHSKIGLAGLEPGAVVIDSHVDALRMEPDSLAFGSVGEFLRVPQGMVHTSMPADPTAEDPVLESWFADTRVDVGAPEFYDQPCWGNRASFATKLAQVRQREVAPAQIEARLAALAAKRGGPTS